MSSNPPSVPYSSGWKSRSASSSPSSRCRCLGNRKRRSAGLWKMTCDDRIRISRFLELPSTCSAIRMVGGFLFTGRGTAMCSTVPVLLDIGAPGSHIVTGGRLRARWPSRSASFLLSSGVFVVLFELGRGRKEVCPCQAHRVLVPARASPPSGCNHDGGETTNDLEGRRQAQAAFLVVVVRTRRSCRVDDDCVDAFSISAVFFVIAYVSSQLLNSSLRRGSWSLPRKTAG